jgi:phenylalanyl-tRNA synthetase beta chain
MTAAAVEAAIRQAAGDLLAGVRLFDLYAGGQLAPGRKSLAYSLVYQAQDRTLTDDEVAQVRAQIVTALADELGAELRG